MEPSQVVLKITLPGIRPPIWRRVRVSSEMSLAMLHDVIQAAMGWEDAHLHEFRVGSQRYGQPTDDVWPGTPRTKREQEIQIGSLVSRRIKKFWYVYDFGDNWDHEVVVEKVEPLDPEQQYPSLIAGKGCCPPEDCGGRYGYMRILEAIADPAAEEHAELSEWVGEEFDPDRLEKEPINQRLASLARPNRKPGRSGRRSR